MRHFAVVLPALGVVACRAGIADCVTWRTRAEAWRSLGAVLTWETEYGAHLFAEMNGGTVTPLAEVFDPSVILPPHGPLQHSTPEAGPLESSSCRQTSELMHEYSQSSSGGCHSRPNEPGSERVSTSHLRDDHQSEMVRPVNRDEPATWLVVVWLVVVLLLVITAKYGVAPS